MIEPQDAATPLVVWLLTDLKPGHRNQLQGLINWLQQQIKLEAHWLPITDYPIKLRDWWFKRNPVMHLPKPHWVVGAGHATHLPLLLCKKIYAAKTVVLMKPSLPLTWFDACVIPEHDNPPQRQNVFSTLGVLNTMVPKRHGRKANQGLILIGGVNKHFQWQDDAVLKQVQQICLGQPQIRWTLTNSRRTPEAFIATLQSLGLENLQLVPYTDTPSGWVKQKLETCAQAWVSRDSVSMVYESVTAAVPTGLLQLPPIKSSRVVKSMQQVLERGWAQDYNGWDMKTALPENNNSLWEARRAGQWLLERLVKKP